MYAILSKSTLIPATKKLHENSDGTGIYSCKFSDISDLSITRWKMNRPHDPTRIPEIVSNIQHQDYVDGIIYLVASNIEGCDLWCYDGLHRLEALKEYKVMGGKIDHTIIVHFAPVYNERQTYIKFCDLNRCVPVPLQYVSEGQNTTKVNESKVNIEEIASYMLEKYKKMFKPSKRPNVPHENRDSFMDKLNEIISVNNMPSKKETIIDVLEQYNKIAKNLNHTHKLSSKQRDKCRENDCYIFARRDWHTHIMKMHTQNLIKCRRINNYK
jgi:hypothetical protein